MNSTHQFPTKNYSVYTLDNVNIAGQSLRRPFVVVALRAPNALKKLGCMQDLKRSIHIDKECKWAYTFPDPDDGDDFFDDYNTDEEEVGTHVATS